MSLRGGQQKYVVAGDVLKELEMVDTKVRKIQQRLAAVVQELPEIAGAGGGTVRGGG